MRHNQSQAELFLPKSGCYSVEKNKQSIQLPLKFFSYDVAITDSISEVKMIQSYINNTKGNLQIQYIFPVFPNSIITSLQISFSGKKTKAIVISKQEASNKYRQYEEQGWGIGLLEYRMSSQDTMTIMIGNINRNQQIIVQLEYVHNNPLAVNGIYQYTLASTITPRYVDKYSPKQLVIMERNDSKYVEGNCNWSIKIQVKSQNKIAKIQSLTHQIKTKLQNNKLATIEFAQPYKPNKDFTLYYSFQNFQEPSVALFNQDNRTSAVITFLPKLFDISVSDAMKKAIQNKQFEIDLDASKGEFIFVLDRSGSMDGIRIQNALAALEIFLRSLPEDSYFNVVSFGSSYKFLFDKSVKNQRNTLQQAIQLILQMEANMGGTEILDPIKILMTKEVINGYPRQLFLLTDGAISDVLSVLKFISNHTQYTRVNTIGVGNGCSKELIIGCAKQGKGYHILIDDKDKQPQKKIIQMLQNSMSPLISDMKVEYDESMVQSIVPNPNKIPYLLKNDQANFYIKFNGKLTKSFKLKIDYKDSRNKSYTRTIDINPQKSNPNNGWVQKIVNAQKLRALNDSYNFDEQKQDRIYYVKDKTLNKQKLLQQIIKQSIKCQILTQFTSFLCIDSQKADQLVKENLKNPKQNIEITQMNPQDHILKAKFISDEVILDDDDEGQFVNQCCITSYQGPNIALQQISRQKQQPKKFKPLPLMMKIVTTTEPTYLQYEGVTNFGNPDKKIPESYIIKRQETNGAWSEDFLDSLFPNSQEMKQRYKTVTSEICYITFLVAQFLMSYYRQSTQYSLIIKKAQNYVNKNSKGGWAELERIYHTDYYKPFKNK